MRTLEVLKEVNNDQLVEIVDLYDQHGQNVHQFISSKFGIKNLIKHFLSSDEFAQIQQKEKWQVLENFDSVQHFLDEFDRISCQHKLGAYNKENQELKAVS